MSQQDIFLFTFQKSKSPIHSNSAYTRLLLNVLDHEINILDLIKILFGSFLHWCEESGFKHNFEDSFFKANFIVL